MPSPSSWAFAWPELLAVAVLSAAYGGAARRYPPSRARAACFAGSMALVVAVFVTPVGTLARHYLLVAHLFQNVVLAEWAPALAVLGLAAGAGEALTRSRAARALTYPLVSLPIWLATYGVWHIPAIYDGALRHPAVLFVEHACYAVAGSLFWWPILRREPHDLPAGGKAATIFAAFVLASPLGLLFALLPRPVYDFYLDAPRVHGLSPLEDQQLAGILMAGTESIVFFCAFFVFFSRFVADET
jgi:putative membrane protein